ncbi:hypothetical protein [Nostoc sp.]|uniref:hypothetical protein n=1 Tax=Nostoc sp. TaxID=1180 RepID=UPI002FFC4F36
MQRGKRDRFTDQEFFDACNRLSLMVGQNNITVLLAKVYAEQLIASKDVASNISALPENIPNLMLGYINELNRDVTDDRFDDRTVHQDAKADRLGMLAAKLSTSNRQVCRCHCCISRFGY